MFFCLKCWWGIQHSASALCHHRHCSQRAFLNFKDLLNILRSVGVHQRIQEKKNLAHNMLVSVILENHRLMFGFSPRGSKHETVMGRRSTLEFGPRKRGRKKHKIKANTSAPTVGAELFAFILGLSNGPESWLNSSETIL